MKLTRGKRIALELLGPPFIGSFVISTCDLIRSVGESVNSVRGNRWDILPGFVLSFALCLVFAYLFVGLQSVVYTLIMEWRFARGLDPGSWRSVGWSTLLGFASGAVISDNLFQFRFGGTGFVVGFILGLLIKSWSAKPVSGV